MFIRFVIGLLPAAALVSLAAKETGAIAQVDARAGVIVEEVVKDGSAARAGLQPGDVLLTWARAANGSAVQGEIRSPFDLSYVEMEQAPRGDVALSLMRAGKNLSVTLQAGTRWNVRVRPQLSANIQRLYEEGKQLIEKNETARGVSLWHKAAAEAQNRKESRLEYWLFFKSAETLTESRKWPEAHESYVKAIDGASTAQEPIAQATMLFAFGAFFGRQSELAQSEETYRAALKILTENLPESLSVAAGLNRLGAVMRLRGNLAEAGDVYQKALEIIERVAPASLDMASLLSGLGVLTVSRGDLAKAEDFQRRALVLREKLAPESVEMATSLSNLGFLAMSRTDLAAAEDFHRRGLAITEKVAPSTLDMALSLNNLGVVARQRGDLITAEDFHLRALAIKEKLAPLSPTLSDTLNDLGRVAEERGDLATAEDFYRRTLSIREKLAPASLTVAISLSSLGHVTARKGDSAAAEEFFRRALAIRERLAPASLAMASTLNDLGVVAYRRGDLAAAEDLYQRSLELTQKLAPSSLAMPGTLNNLGQLTARRGDLAGAEDLYRRSLALREKLAPSSLGIANTLNDLGTVAWKRGDLAAAEDLYRRSLAIREKLAPSSLEMADTLNNIGVVADTRGDSSAAEVLYHQALAIREKLAPSSLTVSMSLNNLGLVAQKRGDLAMAEDFHRRALAIQEKLAPGTLDVAETLHEMGLMRRERKGESTGAIDYFRRAVESLESQKAKLGGADEVRSGFASEYANLYRDLTQELIALGQLDDAFHTVERSRARGLLEMLAERELIFSADLAPELEQERRLVEAEYDRTQERIEQLNPARDGAQIERLLGRLRELRDRQAELREKVRKASPRLAALEYPQPLTLENTQRTLDDGTLLLSYMVSKEETFLFAVRNSAQQADAKLATFRLPISETELRKSVQTFRSGIQHVGESRSTWIQQGRELYDLLVRPAEKWVAASRRVVISPDGPLHRLPFGALVIEQPSDATSAPRYWIETKPLHVVTSATLYAELKKERRQAPVSLVAFGDPSYAAFAANRSEAVQDPEVRSATRQGFALGPLPSTRTEVQAIAELYGDQASVFLGTEATEERAKMIARDARYVHFATHGILDEQFPLNSALALTIPGRRVDGQDNGLLQAWEIFERVRIDADLVVLSACETALGKELGGEGLLGLTRAFQYAGARSIVASLWSVADESTAELMKRFYTYLKEGRTKDEALRSAQIDLIRRSRSTSLDTAHPFYWAAFELIGDWK